MFGRRLGLILILLALDTVLVLVAVNDVGLRDQLRTTHASLVSTKTQLYYSQLSTRIVNTRLQRLQGESAAVESALMTNQNTLQDALETAIDDRQGLAGNAGTIIVDLPRVHGVGGAVILTPGERGNSSGFSATTVANGGEPGRTYLIAWGECPEDLATQNFTASAVLGSPSTIVPAFNIILPAKSTRFWLRMHVATPAADALSGVLGGVLGPFSQGPNGMGTPVPPNRPAC